MPEQKPNVILVTTDQHRGDYLSLAGHPVIETPNIDSWVDSGAYFPKAYSEIPSTTGARRILHSGKGSFDCGLVGYQGSEWHEPNVLASVLADAGYHCINVGFRNMHPRRKLYGFHTVIPHDIQRGADDYMDWLEEKAGPRAFERGHGCDANGWTARPWHLDENLHPTVWTAEVCLEQVAKRDPTKPIFLWCSYHRPHSPYDPPQFFWDMYIDRKLPEIPVGDWAERYATAQPGIGRTAWCGQLTDWQNHRCRVGYMGSITHIDYQIGRMMEQLRRSVSAADARNTLWLLCADHGDMMGDHHLHRKTYAYEGSARIPFVIRYPAGTDLPAGTFDGVVGIQDVMPTILDMAGVEPPQGMTGRSVVETIDGNAWREFLHGEHSPCYDADAAMHYLTDGKQKYIWFPMTGEEQLFDLQDDPQELHNLAADDDQGERVAMWRGRLIELLGERGDGFSDGEQLMIQDEPWPPKARGPNAPDV